MIVAVLAEKDGTGKTTLATNLAGMRAAAGRRVLLIDADRQGSANFWAQTRSGNGLPRVDSVSLHGEAFVRRLRNPPTRYDDTVIDVGAGDNLELEGALATADTAIAPLQPSGVDVRTMGLVDSRVADAREFNLDLTAWALLNRVSPNPLSRDEDDARRALADCTALTVAGIRVCDRVAFRRALTSGRTVMEHTRRADRARDEMAGVYGIAFGEGFNPEQDKPTRGERQT